MYYCYFIHTPAWFKVPEFPFSVNYCEQSCNVSVWIYADYCDWIGRLKVFLWDKEVNNYVTTIGAVILVIVGEDILLWKMG